MKKFVLKYAGKLPVSLFVLTLVLAVASPGWCVGADLLAGASFTGIADDVIATALPVVTAMVPVLALIVAIRYARKIVGLFAR